MTVKLLTELHLDFLSLKGHYTGSSESMLVKMSHCCKSHVVAQRGTFICAHAWIFFKFCMLITHYIRTMKMCLSIRKLRIRLKKQP